MMRQQTDDKSKDRSRQRRKRSDRRSAAGQGRSQTRKARDRQALDPGKRSQVTLAVSLVVLVIVIGLSYVAISRYVNMQNCLTNPACLFGGGEAEPAPAGEIANNIRYKSVSLGGKTYQQARESLANSEETLLSGLGKLKLYYTDDDFVEKTPYELGMRLDIDQILKDAEAESKKLLNRKFVLDDRFRMDPEASNAALDALEEELGQEGGDAKATGFNFETNKFEFEDEKEGRELVKDKSAKLIKEALDAKDYGRKINLEFKRVAPGRTAKELNEHLGFVASATTPIVSYSEARNQNVRVAADRINGTILNPGDTFSFNTTVGKITQENGFALAGVQDADGNDGLGLGGGICQPSTTLYQAAVRANLTIDIHNFHSTPVPYCPIGTDAMVSDWSDLVFTNNSEYPYAIVSRFDGANLSFDFYGPTDPDGGTYDLYVEDLGSYPVKEEPKQVQDDSLQPRETEVRSAPRPNRHVKVYKIYSDAAGNMVSKELMYDHVYPGFAGVIGVNDPDKSTKPGSTEAPVVAYYVNGPNGEQIPVYETQTERETSPPPLPQP